MRPDEAPGGVERAIRDAMGRGEFLGLPGEGRPLSDDGLPMDERWAAKHVLRNANAVPAWADLRKEIDAERERLVRRARAHLGWLAARHEQLARASADRILETARATDARDAAVRAAIDAAVSELNALIRRYDLIVPVGALQLADVTSREIFEVAGRPLR